MILVRYFSYILSNLNITRAGQNYECDYAFEW